MRWQFRIACAVAASLLVLAAWLAGDGAGAQERAPRARSGVARTGTTERPRSRRSRSVESPTAAAEEAPAPPPSSRSVGRHNTGRLEHGREILASEHIRLKHPNGDQHHGTDELVGLIERSAAAVAAQFPGSQLTVGDLSRRRGGRMPPHRSHRSGRDADIGFYIVDTSGQLAYVDRFIDFRADGTTRTNPEWRFDDARNWAFVAAMISQDEAPVQYVFVARWLKRRLLAHAASIGAPQATIDRAEAILDQPRRGGRHEDHFHVRIYCPADDRPRCQDDPPWHAWVARPTAEELAQLREADRARRSARTRRSRREGRPRTRRGRRAVEPALVSTQAPTREASGG